MHAIARLNNFWSIKDKNKTLNIQDFKFTLTRRFSFLDLKKPVSQLKDEMEV